MTGKRPASKIKQGQIWWAYLPLPAGHRPVLILTRSIAIHHLKNVTVAPLSRTLHDIESEVVLSPDHGLPSVCAISLDNILTISRRNLDRYIASLDTDTMNEVFDAIRFVFAMS